jgi:asparagine synthase (glutamine-hydrolysing)
MCGIAGIAGTQTNRHQQAVESMVNALRHRGPDGAGLHTFPHCSLGHTRLSIVDLNTGDQPMLSSDGDVAITFNGEIYGYKDIKRSLSDYKFRTTSDTEVILALYERHGANLLAHLPGMFAFAIWDEREQALFAARDRFGEKPFYFAWGRQGEFLFASEIKSLIASELFTPKLDRAALAHYLRHLYVHPQQTIYSNVFVLPPAHRLTLIGGNLSIEPYWKLPASQECLSNQEAVEEFRRLFEKAVDRQLIADVPVGAFLSGGLDSSSVVAAASRTHPHLTTFSYGFPDAIDELPYAREIAQLYHTNHVELEDQDLDLAELIHTMADVYDEPFADSSNVPTYLISRAARRHGKVALTGDGGDELLAGYDFWYRPLWEMERDGSMSAGVAALLRLSRSLSYRLNLPVPASWQSTGRGAELRAQHATIAEAHATQNFFFSDEEQRSLGMSNGHARHQDISEVSSPDTLDAALRMDLLDYMPGDILVKTDRASMAHGLELRAPFLDVDFASFCISLPTRLKINAREDKVILRRAYGDSWTEAVRGRTKCGFGAPVSQWLKREGVVEVKERILNNPRHALFSLVPFEGTRPFVNRDNYQAWSLLTLGLWLEHGREGYL